MAFLSARLKQEATLYGVDRIGAIGLYPEAGTGFEVQVYLRPCGLLEEVEADDDLDHVAETGGTEPPSGPGYRPEIVVPQHEIDTEGRSHTLHETYTDVATRGLIRSVADEPMVALTITVARMFVILALQGGASTEQSASTLQGRRYGRGALPANPALDSVVRDRLESKRRVYLASGLRPIPWVDGLPHGEKMELLAELTAISLDLREVGVGAVRPAARAEAAEIADLTGHEITAYWTPDAAFLSQHSKAQLMGALATMEADTTPTKGLEKNDLVGYVGSVAAEKAWAPPALNLRLEMAVIPEPETALEAAEDLPAIRQPEVDESFAEAA